MTTKQQKTHPDLKELQQYMKSTQRRNLTELPLKAQLFQQNMSDNKSSQ